LKPKKIIAGIDEVGKGALFGPVFAGAVVLNNSEENLLKQAGLKDSKKLTRKKISQLSSLIKNISNSWGLGQASANEIDIFGIRESTERAMIRAIEKLPNKPESLLVDGNLSLRLWEGEQKTLVKGEDQSLSIAAASVIAKEARDQLIKRLAKKFPEYGLEKNVGYGTKIHCQSIKINGPSKLHRISFLRKIIY
tara:strand:+ start:9576 stop:10157 length:582 start_codon:yes stop_codon:yes gene_type:complete